LLLLLVLPVAVARPPITYSSSEVLRVPPCVASFASSSGWLVEKATKAERGE
jgi:hypothetical protein